MSVFVIAEVGSATNGNFHLAKEMILEADRVGADAVKFQALESSVRNSWAKRLKEIADDVGVELMVTPFDLKAVDAWDPYVKRWKIASAEMRAWELLGAVLATDKPILISTGMANMDEVKDLHEFIGERVDRVDLLHCVAEYPAPYEHMNLLVIPPRVESRQLFVGLSDHTIGWHVAIAAVALGAQVIEKHFRPARVNFKRANVPFDRKHPDHGSFALDPPQFQTMVRWIRDVEKALGDGIKRPMPGEAIEARGRRLQSA